MGVCRVFLRSAISTGQLLDALEALRPFDVLDGPVGQVDVLGIRAGLLVEVVAAHGDSHGSSATGLRRLVRFFAVNNEPLRGSAWVAAHAFLWILTQRYEIDEAMLLSPVSEPLRYSGGRIRPISMTDWH